MLHLFTPIIRFWLMCNISSQFMCLITIGIRHHINYKHVSTFKWFIFKLILFYFLRHVARKVFMIYFVTYFKYLIWCFIKGMHIIHARIIKMLMNCVWVTSNQLNLGLIWFETLKQTSALVAERQSRMRSVHMRSTGGRDCSVFW